MAKEEGISVEGTVVEALPNAMFSNDAVAAPIAGPQEAGAASPPSGTGDDFSDLYGPRNDANKPITDDFRDLYPK